jgi:hypothetical protein
MNPDEALIQSVPVLFFSFRVIQRFLVAPPELQAARKSLRPLQINTALEPLLPFGFEPRSWKSGRHQLRSISRIPPKRLVTTVDRIVVETLRFHPLNGF